MPLRYGPIPEEHQKVRLCSGMFDLCHMGRLEICGPGAEEWVDRVFTNDVSRVAAGNARYGLVTTEEGTVIDDAIAYRLPHSILLVVNAANRERVKDWMGAHKTESEAELADRTMEWAMIAVQGPQSSRIVPPLFDQPQKPWSELRYYQILSASFEGHPAWVARTGYTGEDGFEVYLAAEDAVAFWHRALEEGGNRIAPIGLGARDTLRLEAGMPLYGQEIDETTNPFEARLGFAVKLDKKTAFVGQDRLRALKKEGLSRRLCGLRVAGRRVARQGMRIYCGERDVGVITSGAPSPTLGYPIAMGYVEVEAEKAVKSHRASLTVDLRGRREEVTLEALPFYSRTRKREL